MDREGEVSCKKTVLMNYSIFCICILSVYVEMKENGEAIISRLKEVYSDSVFVAYSNLCKLK